mmetsp:Transcript_8905/g.19000  ORF Transcript_8905/g.19000 Transcript_8905/m.19000 type:complete len:237 (+) Transcript_8905:176-886(+)|eukprot:CAMPEP_0202900354 /NCGR_PEP_ID=MMETSP1392-20130828/11213_1 /ASSEMBLY_ACC=CAM_ASM_000868 /TAXON_ID=225041 /ORGANISM="Chlamydomonas chlamydogama, Strain SAG 11-48b" /LENGTH=236 /DNA_ID=CAMNT_0049586729 /DNA_START=176 /DNA_END=886 /DNA_ORIENTATION=+
MSDNQQPAADPLANLFSLARDYLPELLDKLELLPPGAEQYVDSHVLATKAKAGDQIMVQSPSGYWHHGIMIGMQPDAHGQEQYYVVDVWGENKESSTISQRPYNDFVAGKVGFARAHYGQKNVLPRAKSKALALYLVDVARQRGFQYNVLERNCEHFATWCRIGRNTSHQVCEVHKLLSDMLPITVVITTVTVAAVASVGFLGGSLGSVATAMGGSGPAAEQQRGGTPPPSGKKRG